jgi:predicted nicotinamide N-methyase
MDSEALSSFFLNCDYTLNSFSISGQTFSLYSLASAMTDFDLTGQVVWPSAILLSEHILENKKLLVDKRVIELGAGAGLSGYISSFFAKEVVLTDGNEVVVSLLEKNIEFWQRDNICCRKLEWGSANTEEMLENWHTNTKKSAEIIKSLLVTDEENNFKSLEKKQENNFDVIIGADVVFWPGAIQPLVQTLEVLMGKRDCEVWIAGCKRALNVEKAFEEELGEKGMKRELLKEREGVFLYKIVRI